MDLAIRSKTVGASPVWLDTTETLRYLTDGVTIDAAATQADSGGVKLVKSGAAVGKITSSGKYRRSPVAALAADTAGASPNVDVDDASAFVVGDTFTVGATGPLTIDSITLGGGAGGSDRIVATGNVGAVESTGAKVAVNDGSEDAVGLLLHDATVTERDQHGSALDHGRVRTAALPYTLHADQKTALQNRGVSFR